MDAKTSPPSARRRRPWTVRPWTLVVLALASDRHTLRLMIAHRYYAGDVLHVGPYERRFDAIRPFLQQRGIVGYLSDRMDAGEQYYLTQYALAPLVISRSPGHTVVVTPLRLEWQLGTSLPRLLTQLWPTAVLLFGLVVQSPSSQVHTMTSLPEHSPGRASGSRGDADARRPDDPGHPGRRDGDRGLARHRGGRRS